jgi:hypothetical protein
MFYIEYTSIPTRYNNKQVVQTSDLSSFVHLKGDQLDFTNQAKRNLYIGNYGALIGRIYEEHSEKNEVHILYKYQEHFGDKLKNILNVAPIEILV